MQKYIHMHVLLSLFCQAQHFVKFSVNVTNNQIKLGIFFASNFCNTTQTTCTMQWVNIIELFNNVVSATNKYF